METLIAICLLIVIVLILHDKVVIKKVTRKRNVPETRIQELPEIMGRPKPVARHPLPNAASKSQMEEPAKVDDTFDTEIEQKDFGIVIPQEELDEVFGEGPDLEEEEEEWRRYGAPNGEDGFATGVTFEELSTVGTLLQQEKPEPALEERAVDIVHRIQGTELFSLLENSIENASQKIARLLDTRSVHQEADSGSSTMRNNGLADFDIREFV